MKDYKILVIYHNNDTDGYTSGALAKMFYDNVRDVFNRIDINLIVEYKGYNYGKDSTVDTWLNPFNENEMKYNHIVFIDVTPPLVWFEIVENEIKNGNLFITIFDHHQFAYNDIMNRFNDVFSCKNVCYFFDNKICGAKIFYKTIQNDVFAHIFASNIISYLQLQKRIFGDLVLNNVVINIERMVTSIFGNKKLDLIIDLVDSYDTWKWKNDDHGLNALAINEFLIQLDYKKEDLTLEYVYQLFSNFGTDFFRTMLDKGHEIIKVKEKQALKQQHFIVDIFGEKVCIINEKANTYSIDYVKSLSDKALNQELSGPNFNPEIEKYFDIKCILFYNNIDWIKQSINFSLRQVKDGFDCNSFAKEIANGNAGGHLAASGGSLSLTKFIELINN
jgi:oligoribonuclease NrnB/cAMP/cGMP phosphodiesterase (DHH superfamily)